MSNILKVSEMPLEQVNREILYLLEKEDCSQCGQWICWCDGSFSDAAMFDALQDRKSYLETLNQIK